MQSPTIRPVSSGNIAPLPSLSSPPILGLRASSLMDRSAFYGAFSNPLVVQLDFNEYSPQDFVCKAPFSLTFYLEGFINMETLK